MKKLTLSTLIAALMLGCAQQDVNEIRDDEIQNPTVEIKQAVNEPNEERVLQDEQLRSRKMLAKEKTAAAGQRVQPELMQMMAPPAEPALDRENYQKLQANGVILVSEQPVSTFSIDVDTASYANVRRFLKQGQLPRQDAVRLEEMVNYFSYPSYQLPEETELPFSLNTEVAVSPWNKHTHLLRIGLQGYQVDNAQLPPANLVFLVDVSGSMSASNKLPLLQRSLRMLTKTLTEKDRVSIVTYAGNAGVVLEPTSGADKAKILMAIDNMSAGGSTHGSAGIEAAYQLAEQHMIEGGINRVLIGSDGDMNVGTVSVDALKELVALKRSKGISLTTLGFGSGNYNDHLMEQLADIGNGNSAYIDSLSEARRVLVENRGSTLLTIAKDVKIQLEFSPAVKEYRLLGYENRLLKREDFNNDKIDAGDIGAGHSVTALYEITLAEQPGKVDPLRYSNEDSSDAVTTSELAYIKLRYKRPEQTQSQLFEQAVLKADVRPFEQASLDFQWATAVAAFAQQLKGGEHLGQFDYDAILDLATRAKGVDTLGYRAEMTQLVRMAHQITKDGL